MDPDTDLVNSIALDFSRRLRQYLSREDYDALVRRTREQPEKDICHSHDYLDANEVMAASFKKVTGKAVDVQSQADCDLWGAAWDKAKSRNFALVY